MSAASKSNSQSTFVDAASRIDINITSPDGYDTPIPTTSTRLSDETLANLMEARMKLENLPTNPSKRRRSGSPTPGPSSEKRKDDRESYPPASKPIYLRLKNLYKKKLSLASNIRTIEQRLTTNKFPTSVDFRFSANNTRDPTLRSNWEQIILKCKQDLTKSLLDDMHAKYGQIKGLIDQNLRDLQGHLDRDQLSEIQSTLNSKFKQMAPIILQRKEKQFKPRIDPRKDNRKQKAPAQRKRQVPVRRNQQPRRDRDDKLAALVSSLKNFLN